MALSLPNSARGYDEANRRVYFGHDGRFEVRCSVSAEVLAGELSKRIVSARDYLASFDALRPSLLEGRKDGLRGNSQKHNRPGSRKLQVNASRTSKVVVMQYPIPPHQIGRSGKEKLMYVSEFAQRFRLDKVEENRLRKLLGPIAKEIDLLRNAGRL